MGEPFQPTMARRQFRRTAHGRASGEVLHERLHRPRPLFASRQAYCPVHRVYDDCSQSYSILSDLSIPFPRKFLRFLLLDHVYQMSTKKSGKALGNRAFPLFHFLGVYQMSTKGTFSLEKRPFLFALSGFSSPFLLCKGRYTFLASLYIL